ncbi:hypothetical protein [Nitritalea halalkaliphila]|uniref:hypothetical protein n=1 Tax=Nitritalea halalkaliphila TaxID=590849 RepID=UPI0012EA3150|nr:hypothetical protein [Nitritalea halalkaliphila]
MKKLTLLIVLGVFFTASLPSQQVQADPNTVGHVASLAKLVIEGIDKGCDNLRESGALQKRCKNDGCITVACISFRQACGSASDCKK